MLLPKSPATGRAALTNGAAGASQPGGLLSLGVPNGRYANIMGSKMHTYRHNTLYTCTLEDNLNDFLWVSQPSAQLCRKLHNGTVDATTRIERVSCIHVAKFMERYVLTLGAELRGRWLDLQACTALLLSAGMARQARGRQGIAH